MNESKHTPGPWVAKRKEEFHPKGHEWEVRTETGEPITGWGRVRHPEADARLIAAAPDLLEACQAIDALMENLWKAIDWGKSFNLDVQKLNEAPLKIKRAIKKATE